MKYLSPLLLLCCWLLPIHGRAQSNVLTDAAPIVRDFMQGYYFKDAQALKRSTLGGADLKTLVDHPTLPDSIQEAFKQDIAKIQLENSFPSAWADSTRVLVTFKMKDSPWVLPVVQEGQIWKVDPRYAVASRTSYQPQDPPAVLKLFVTALFKRDKKELAQVTMFHDSKELEDFLKNNRFASEDREMLLQWVSVLPLAPAQHGERIRFPNGEVRRADNDENEQIFLGLIGPSELAFRVEKLEGQWKVYPQPYVQSLKSDGVIR